MWVLSMMLLLAGCASAPHEPLLSAVRLSDVNGQLVQPLASVNRAAALIFIAHDCPICNGYAPEINRIVKKYQSDDIHFYLVHADAELSREQARQHAKDYGYTCPVLMDPNHDLVKTVGATITPEAVIVDAQGHIAYRGRIDDQYVDFGKKRAAASTHDLRDALDAILAGRAVANPRTAAIGCYISDSR